MKKFRDQHEFFIAEGDKIATELLAVRFDIEMVCALPEWLGKHNDHIPEGVACHEITQKTLERISTTKNPNQVLVVAKQPGQPFPASFPSGDVVLMLDRINDPGNMGSIIRTADWFGIREIVCSPGSADIYNPKVIQASMGSFMRVKCYYTNLEAIMQEYADKMTLYGAFMDGDNVFEKAMQFPAAVVIGNESHGISPAVASLLDHRVSVPGGKKTPETGAESLNAAIAAGIIMACFRRAG